MAVNPETRNFDRKMKRETEATKAYHRSYYFVITTGWWETLLMADSISSVHKSVKEHREGLSQPAVPIRLSLNDFLSNVIQVRWGPICQR